MRDAVREAFPELASIDDPDLREGVLRAWTTACEDAGVTDLEAVPWLPPTQAELDLPDERLVPHVRDVTRGALALAEILTEREAVAIDVDTLVAGALVHDVSKLAEFDGTEPTAVYDLLGHPHYGVHVAASAGLPVAVQHVLLAHTARTSVEPATIEAELVRRADEAAAAAIRSTRLADLRDA
jgi:hypothetical protein